MYPASLFTDNTPFLLGFLSFALFLLARSRRDQRVSRVASSNHAGGPAEHAYRPSAPVRDGQSDFQYMLTDRLTLHAQVARAIECSLQANKVVGVIVIQNSHLAEAIGREEMDTAIEALGRIREIVAMPHFLHVSNSEIAIFVPCLKFRATLEALAEKLQQGLTSYGANEYGLSSCSAGAAMYPIDGYGSEDLLASAKSKIEARAEAGQVRKVGNLLQFELSGSRKTRLNMAVSRAHARVMAC